MLKLKPLRQTSGFCGPAALKIVLDYYGFKISEARLAKIIMAKRKTGTKPRQMTEGLKFLGYHGFWKENGKIKDLEYFIKLGLPIIVNWFSCLEGHYSVVVGLEKGNIVLMDPEIAKARKVPVKVFEKIWWDFERPYAKKWHFKWFLVPTLKKKAFKIEGNYF